ncbi:uncharacterized protein LOC143289303 [Babylonia areolata]|uniref:uncharacterized protein LOC143289303 n=1 Tax=Babylonia areolata TaxID=304850 RepID=UPI003FCF5CB8
MNAYLNSPAQSTASPAKPQTPPPEEEDHTTVAPPPHSTIPSLLDTAIDEDSESSAGEEADETGSVGKKGGEKADETVPPLLLGLRTGSSLTGGGTTPSSLDTSFDEGGSDCGFHRHTVQRDRSHTWSHGSLNLRTAKRSGSLPPMDSMMSHVPKLNLSEGRDSPFPTTTPTGVSPRRYGKLLVCSEHRMSTSPRLPPIGCVSDLQSPRSLPKNTPRELSREVSLIDPALIDNSDPTEVRMMGRRRNALMTPQPDTPDLNS